MREFDSIQRVVLIKEMCTGKRVLHLGCTNWPYTEQAIADEMLLHFELAKAAAELVGIDADQEGIEILERHGSTGLVHGDLEHLDECSLDGTFDVIVAGEVIEHVSNPGFFLSGVKRFMADGSQLVLTTPNAYCAMRFFYYGLRGRRGKAEPVHPDHVAYYSYSTLKLLIERHGLELSHFYFYDLGREHRPFVRWPLRVVNDISVRLVPQSSDGLIAICRLKP